mgnify:CR=1 FL=1
MRDCKITGRPHVGIDLTVELSGWRRALVDIGGAIFPTVLGYVSFAVWMSGVASRWRQQRPGSDLGWSALTAALLFPQVGATPIWLAVADDNDYLGFVGNVGWSSWASNGALIAVALVNLVLVAVLVKHVVRRRREVLGMIRSGPEGGQNLGA